MPPGPAIRRRLGRLELPLVRGYRALYVSLPALAERVAARTGDHAAVLEIGCGDGQLTRALAGRFPAATITGIDVLDAPGRLYDGPRERVSFHTAAAGAFGAAHARSFDLVLVCDVLHHAPRTEHRGLLEGAREALAPGGWLVVKDWRPSRTPIHVMAWASDRWLSGQRPAFQTAGYLRELVEGALGEGSVRAQEHVPPWRSNVLLFARPQAVAAGPAARHHARP